MDMSFTLSDERAVLSAAKILRSRYRDYAEFDDIKQELYLWLLTNYEKVQRWRAEREPEYAERTVVKALRNAGEVYCRNEKAEREGYIPEDEFFYSIPMVADLLALHFDPDWMVPQGVALDDRTTGGKPPSEGGNLIAMVADVGRAYQTLTKHDQTLLERVYGPGVDTRDAIAVEALEWGISVKAADSRIRRVVGRLRAKLGGPNPHNDERKQ